MTDDLPPHGITRPPLDLTAADPITVWCAEERARIRAEFAAAAAKARRWEPGQ